MSTSPAPPPGYPPHYGHGRLVVIIREPVGALGMIDPLVTIDGYPAPARWGPNAYPIASGRHQLRVWARYLFEYGAAEQVVDIAPGQSLELHYSAPMITFLRGRIGFTPQPRPGMVGPVAVLSGMLLVLVVITLAGILTG